jgi:hypothetical protein
MMDYLAEVTMSIMQKQRSRDPEAGYARDFVPLMERIFPTIVEKGCAGHQRRRREPRRMRGGPGGSGAPGRRRGRARVGVVTGRRPDGPPGRPDGGRARAPEHGDGEPLATIRDRVESANAYIGATPIVKALEAGPTSSSPADPPTPPSPTPP